MSYREVRNFIELMRELGFQRKISLQNFKTPNFLLVAELLYWMVQKYDPNTQMSDNIDDEKDRVGFVNGICQLFAIKARIKLNPRKLYEANVFAVREMLKIATMLSKAITYSGTDEESVSSDFNLSGKLFDLKQARQMAKDITEIGAKLFDKMDKETDLQQSRTKALEFLDSISKNLDSNKEQEYIEKCIKDIIATQKESVSQMEKMYENLKQDEESLEQKIKRKSDELERAEKRLKSIQNVRPAFMDEYEQLEKELEKLYSIYVERYRNLDYLEKELDVYNQKEQRKREIAEKALEEMRKKIKKDELDILKGEKPVNETEVDQLMMKGLDDMSNTKTGFHKQPQPTKQQSQDSAGEEEEEPQKHFANERNPQRDGDDDEPEGEPDGEGEGEAEGEGEREGDESDNEQANKARMMQQPNDDDLRAQDIQGNEEDPDDENNDSEAMQDDEPDNDF